MKNYQIGDSVTIIKAGMFKDLPGKVLSNNTETIFKPLSVILDNGLGTWQYAYDEVALTGKSKGPKTEAMPWDEPDSSANLKVVTKAAKRPYKKRVKDQPVKEKRKYVKKAKS